MDPVTKLPLTKLATEQGLAEFVKDLDRDAIRNLLRLGAVRFVIADLGYPLRWIPVEACFTEWKRSIQAYLATSEELRLEQFPEEFALTASEWNDGGLPIVLLTKHH